MSPSQLSEHDSLVRATRFAIARAKRRGSTKVTPDDVLAGLLHASARFGIIGFGPWTIDLEEFGEAPLEETDATGPKVAYTPDAAALFDRAASIARQDRSAHVEVVHMLVTFAGEEEGLMGRLKRTYGFDGKAWRAALARWQPMKDGGAGQDAATPRSAAAPVQELLSPDEAAAFLGVHTQTVRGYMRSGKLPAHRLAGERVLRIRRQDLLALLEPYDPE